MSNYMQRAPSLDELKQSFQPLRTSKLKMDLLQNRFGLLRWLVPSLLLCLVVVYEIGPSRWIYDRYGFNFHLAAEIMIFAIIGPVLAFALLNIAGRWMDEKDTSDWQAHLLDNAREHKRKSRQLNDDALQVLFATGTLFKTLKADGLELPPDSVAQIEAAEEALDEAVNRLRDHLQNS
jgi:signal transduction histidine kinase